MMMMMMMMMIIMIMMITDDNDDNLGELQPAVEDPHHAARLRGTRGRTRGLSAGISISIYLHIHNIYISGHFFISNIYPQYLTGISGNISSFNWKLADNMNGDQVST